MADFILTIMCMIIWFGVPLGMLAWVCIIKAIVTRGEFYMGNDPVECCEYYKKNGCAHVDDMLCNNDCDE